MLSPVGTYSATGMPPRHRPWHRAPEFPGHRAAHLHHHGTKHGTMHSNTLFTIRPTCTITEPTIQPNTRPPCRPPGTPRHGGTSAGLLVHHPAVTLQQKSVARYLTSGPAYRAASILSDGGRQCSLLCTPLPTLPRRRSRD